MMQGPKVVLIPPYLGAGNQQKMPQVEVWCKCMNNPISFKFERNLTEVNLSLRNIYQNFNNYYSFYSLSLNSMKIECYNFILK